MCVTEKKLTLFVCDEEHDPHNDSVKYLHPESGAWVELLHDEDPHHPIADQEGVEVVFRESDRYEGTTDAIPGDLAVECKRCGGTGSDIERYELRRGYFGDPIGAGTLEAMEFLREQGEERGDDRLCVEPAYCLKCKGNGETEASSIEEYLKVSRSARAVAKIDTGNQGCATAYIYITDDEWTDPEDAAKAYAEEYRSWAEGDVWGIKYGTAAGEDEDSSVWGFIGREHAEQEAETFLNQMAADVEKRREANLATAIYGD